MSRSRTSSWSACPELCGFPSGASLQCKLWKQHSLRTLPHKSCLVAISLETPPKKHEAAPFQRCSGCTYLSPRPCLSFVYVQWRWAASHFEAGYYCKSISAKLPSRNVPEKEGPEDIKHVFLWSRSSCSMSEAVLLQQCRPAVEVAHIQTWSSMEWATTAVVVIVQKRIPPDPYYRLGCTCSRDTACDFYPQPARPHSLDLTSSWPRTSHLPTSAKPKTWMASCRPRVR